MPPLKISSSNRYFITADGKPFFWLGDTGWMLFLKCTREEAIEYLDKRKAHGFNVIQVMVLHDLKEDKNIYGDSLFIDLNVSKPKITEGNNFLNKAEYDYWDHVEYIVDEAAKRNMYMALVPVWGSNVKSKWVNEEQVVTYASFLAERFKNKSNIIWVNGGDLKGSIGIEVWNALGKTLHEKDPGHLISFHPRGRHTSSLWFHNQDWLAFNMIQSGHKDYQQDTSASDIFHYGEDNWCYIDNDYALSPVKPTMDAEPSYENIPHGLHDSMQPRWTDADLRRYAYWSVFAGGAGFTYGENAVMQFHSPNDKSGSYGVDHYWKEGLNAKGAAQMQYLKKLLLSKNYLERIPDQALVADQEKRYNYLAATRGNDYAFVYTYTGRKMKIYLGKCKGSKIKCSWYNPRNGQYKLIGIFPNTGVKTFTPPGKEKNGNDWVLVMESIK
ncbi:glycoside hydrolase family 140 protein [Ferruginibacter lapsinanis]|uniref:glycoside hydrolase family 140 protein n=1 Tax=Ferruginibacter lapsinanis TaxID=563172 RepID=UPI001E36FBD7|nr:glycoside hydrolase family 140 protein [Ferruginibacter lapsinanis]UEG48781.1 glycoside hydrolase family 140 protein [Ferruginibacter lapsinanis]